MRNLPASLVARRRNSSSRRKEGSRKQWLPVTENNIRMCICLHPRTGNKKCLFLSHKKRENTSSSLFPSVSREEEETRNDFSLLTSLFLAACTHWQGLFACVEIHFSPERERRELWRTDVLTVFSFFTRKQARREKMTEEVFSVSASSRDERVHFV